MRHCVSALVGIAIREKRESELRVPQSRIPFLHLVEIPFYLLMSTLSQILPLHVREGVR